MMSKNSIVNEIVSYTRSKVLADKKRMPVDELRRRLQDAPPVVNFGESLAAEPFGIIAEIKRKSPSESRIREQNFEDAPRVYEAHPLVQAVSILTCDRYFGTSIADLERLKKFISKPILRKDFIVDEYQVYEARAFGADAVLLMANVLSPSELKDLWEVCKSLGMDALFECHNQSQIASLPPDAKVCGINSRKLDSSTALGFSPRFALSRLFGKDVTSQRDRFEMITMLPSDSVKVAESGVSHRNISAVRDQGWNAALIGAALLVEAKGVAAALDDMQTALNRADGKVSTQSGAQLRQSSSPSVPRIV